MKEIQLTQDQVALVDNGDFERLNRLKWCAVKQRNTFYATRHSLRVNGKRHTIYMHHEIIGRPPKGFQVDHRNGTGTDNRRENLRFVTNRQNQQNRKNGYKSSQYPGIHWSRQYKKWYPRIKINGKTRHLGSFDDERKAFEVYRQAVEDLGQTVMGDH